MTTRTLLFAFVLCLSVVATCSATSAGGRTLSATDSDRNTAKAIQRFKEHVPRINLRGEVVSSVFSLEEDYYESMVVLAIPGLILAGISMSFCFLYVVMRYFCCCEPFNNCGGITMNKQGGYGVFGFCWPMVGLVLFALLCGGAIGFGITGNTRTHSAQSKFSEEIISTGNGLSETLTDMRDDINKLTAADDSSNDFKGGYTVSGDYSTTLNTQVDLAKSFVDTARNGRDLMTKADKGRFWILNTVYTVVALLILVALIGAILRLGFPSLILGSSAFPIMVLMCLLFALHFSMSIATADFCSDAEKMVGTSESETGNPDIDQFLKCLDKDSLSDVQANVKDGFDAAFSELKTNVDTYFSCTIQDTDSTAPFFWTNAKTECTEYASLISCCDANSCADASKCDDELVPTNRVFKSTTMFQEIMDSIEEFKSCKYVRQAYTTIHTEICVNALLGVDFMIGSFVLIGVFMLPMFCFAMAGYKRFQRVKTDKREANEMNQPLQGGDYDSNRYPSSFPQRPKSQRGNEGTYNKF